MRNEVHTGIIYCAVGEEYYRQAELSYQSVLAECRNMKASIYTDTSCPGSMWDNIIKSNTFGNISFHNQMIYKLDAITTSPYEYNLFLDSDTYILNPIDELFTLLRKFDMVLCHGHNRNERYTQINAAVKDTDTKLFEPIPYCFAPLQSGLILYKKSTTLTFFEQVKKAYLEYEYYDDQAIIREKLWNSSLCYYILPPEYNFNSVRYLKHLRKQHYISAIPKVFHYTQHKKQNISVIVKRWFNKNDIYRWKTNYNNYIFNRLLNRISDYFKK